MLAHALLGGNGGDVVAQHVRHAPRLGYVTVQGVRLVLGQDDDLEEAGVDHVRQGEVDEAINPAEGHGGLGAIDCQRHEAFALAAGEDDCENTRGGHGITLRDAGHRVGLIGEMILPRVSSGREPGLYRPPRGT